MRIGWGALSPWQKRIDWRAWRRHATDLLTPIADQLAPRLCALCAMPLNDTQLGLCNDCINDLPGRALTRCAVCALALTTASRASSADRPPRLDAPPIDCPDCATRTPAFDASFALGDYAAPLDRAVVVAKFHGQWPLLRALGQALGADWLAHQANTFPAPILVPVPLSTERLTARGYNQAAIIASALASTLGWRLDTRRLRRARDTATQSALNRADREVNMRDAFRCHGRIDGWDIALVDDVMTTGATLHAAAQVLRAAGARRIDVFVIARTSATRRPAGDEAPARVDHV